MNDDINELLTIEETAQLLKVHPTTVRAYVRKYGLPQIPIGHGFLKRYRKADVLAWLESRQVELCQKAG